MSETIHLWLTELTIALSILEGSHMDAQIRELIAEFDGLVASGKFISGIPLCPGTHMESYRSDISSKYLRQSYTGLEFITLELRALIDAWRSESMVTFRLETVPSLNNSCRSLYCHQLRLKDTAVVWQPYRLEK